MKHTPGPWIFEESDFTIRTKDFNSSAGMGDFRGVVIADIDGPGWRQIRPDAIPEKIANARLIATAPELYEMLRQAYTHVANGKPWTDGELEAINALLKKAEADQ